VSAADLTNAPLLHTPLHAAHVHLGARMVPFAGYDMPVQYPLGVLKEHLHTRSAAGVFDVSHMGQVELHGANAAAALESLVPSDILGLAPGKQRYSFFTNEAGGILDDLMIFNAGTHLHIVVNAACKATDIAHLKTHLSKRCELRVRDDLALIALQGPKAVDAIAQLNADVKALTFMTGGAFSLAGIPCQVTRSGYTGEDGVEISVPAVQLDALFQQLLRNPDVQAIGLGARDSLRLEAGLCLYGHDIDTTTTPVEAALTWAMQKVRRAGGARAGGYPGAAFIDDQLANGSPRKRVGLAPQGKAPVREGSALVNALGKQIGVVTSGGFGPTVNTPVAMGYVRADCAAPGTLLDAIVRDKPMPIKVVELPFTPHRYFRG
jgi:aminomethyltransferase